MSSLFAVNPFKIAKTFVTEYQKIPSTLRLLDTFIVCAALTAALQFVYMFLFGSFPFNAFLAGFFGCLGFLVLTVCLRLQINPANSAEFKGLTPEKAFADYVLCNCVLFLVVWSYIG
eukprot:TRINITY_DN4191_c0_g2_i1.p1 TRINITY_DN4191_c0_g2~~TRINITY_DN4191_c0_g2_i1.p1  ORF type:complete len:117 (+),score=2.71 TRINITY_DN4191_c0_g2_i1:188-538(+)